MPTMYLGLDRWPQAFLETANQHLFVRSHDGVKFLKHGLQMFQVCGPVYNIFSLVFSVLFDLTPETIHKDFQITQVFVQKRLEFLPSRWNQSFIIQLLLKLLLAEIYAVLKERCSKKYVVRFFCSGGGKMVFTLLTEIVAGHLVVILINIRKTCLERAFLRVFCSRGSGFYYCLNDILYFLI